MAADDQASVTGGVYTSPAPVVTLEDDILGTDNEVALESLSQWQLAWRRFRRHRLALVGVVILSSMVLIAIIGPFLIPFETMNFPGASKIGGDPPSVTHLFGTDRDGRDVFAMTVHGARTSLAVGFGSVIIAGFIGVIVGAIAGFWGGKVDNILMRVVDVLFAIPFLFVILVAAQFFGQGQVWSIILIFGLLTWPLIARLVRASFLSLREADFVDAARAVGVGRYRIAFRHILPNAVGPVIVAMTLLMASNIILEAFVSYLNFGISATQITWGNSLSNAQNALPLGNWWWALFPGMAIALTVIAINFIGDGLRDALDPRTRSDPMTMAAAAPALEPPDPDAPLLDVRDLRTWFHVMDGTVKAVDGVSFSLGRGRTLGVVGESGCGKSVTALTIMRLLETPPAEIASGEILFEGRDVLKLSEDAVRRLRGFEMAMIFQEPMTSLNPVHRVGNQVSEAIAHHLPVTKQEAADRAVEALRRVGISYPERRARQYPHELSGGMRQRVMIAMGLACEPKLLIADEPTTALDVTIQAQILELIKELQEQTGAALMLITHDLGVVAEMVDEVMVMYAGRVVEHGPVDEVLLQPKHPYTEGLLASIPSRGMRGQRLSVIAGTVPNPFNMPGGCNFAPRCPYRFEPCTIHDPRLGLADGRSVACWRWLEPPLVEPPPMTADGQPLPDAPPPSQDPTLLEPDPVLPALSPDEPARDALPVDPEEAGPRIGA